MNSESSRVGFTWMLLIVTVPSGDVHDPPVHADKLVLYPANVSFHVLQYVEKPDEISVHVPPTYIHAVCCSPFKIRVIL